MLLSPNSRRADVSLCLCEDCMWAECKYCDYSLESYLTEQSQGHRRAFKMHAEKLNRDSNDAV